MTSKQVLAAIAEMAKYKSYGFKAALKGAKSKDNPYNFRCDQGHWWDDGWRKGHREVRLAELRLTKDVREYLALLKEQEG